MVVAEEWRPVILRKGKEVDFPGVSFALTFKVSDIDTALYPIFLAYAGAHSQVNAVPPRARYVALPRTYMCKPDAR
jgi:hypothetical protein